MRGHLSSFSSFSLNLIRKMSPLMLGEILEVFLNILIVDDKYPVQDCENLQLPIQMQLFQKQKTFSEFFVQFLASNSDFKHLKEKMKVTANVFPKIQTVKNLVGALSKTRRFRTCFDSKHVKTSQMLAKSP